MPRTLPLSLAFLLLVIFGLGSCSFSDKSPLRSTQDLAVPPALRAYIDQMQVPLTLMELPDYNDAPPPETISKTQALADIDTLQYILDNAYSGRYYWQQNGVDFQSGYASLRRYLNTLRDETVNTHEFEQRIVDAFIGINDPHTAVIGHDVHEFFTRVRQYFASIVLRREGDRFVVIDSTDPAVKIGAIYTGDQTSLFATLSPTGQSHYLFGQMSKTELHTLTAQFDHRRVELAVHACRIGEVQYDRFNDIISIEQHGAIPVIRSSSFWVKDKISDLEAFAEYGKQLRSTPVFVWNLLANDGGSAQYPAMFIENFNDLAQDESWEAHLHSSAIIQAYLPGKNGWSSWPSAWLDDNTPLSEIPEYKRAHVQQVRDEKIDLLAHPRRYWTIAKEKPAPKLGSYTGKAIILSNYRNGSAGNNALAMSKSIPNSVIVGEQSNLTYTFANTRNFSLKYSRIKLRLPGRLIINPANKIERGFLPDLWLDSAQPLDEVLRWLNEPEQYQFRY